MEIITNNYIFMYINICLFCLNGYSKTLNVTYNIKIFYSHFPESTGNIFTGIPKVFASGNFSVNQFTENEVGNQDDFLNTYLLTHVTMTDVKGCHLKKIASIVFARPSFLSQNYFLFKVTEYLKLTRKSILERKTLLQRDQLVTF